MIVISKHESEIFSMINVQLVCEFCNAKRRKSVHMLDSVRFYNDLPNLKCEHCGKASIDEKKTTSDDTYVEEMVTRKTWKDFRDTRLLWFINTILHVFGWSIVLEIEDGEVVDAYPARVKFRGFSEDINTAGYLGLSEYMAKHSQELLEEAQDED